MTHCHWCGFNGIGLNSLEYRASVYKRQNSRHVCRKCGMERISISDVRYEEYFDHKKALISGDCGDSFYGDFYANNPSNKIT